MIAATPQRQRSLSQAGKDLFQLMPSNEIKKPAAQRAVRSENSFSELQETSEDEMHSSAHTSPHNSPRTVPVSPRFLWGRYEDPGTGSPWQVTSSAIRTGRVPRLNLDEAAGATGAASAVAANRSSANTFEVLVPSQSVSQSDKHTASAKSAGQEYDEDDDDGALFYSSMDVKSRRRTGNETKPNTHKAMEQRLFQMEKRDLQRQRSLASSSASRSVDADVDSGSDIWRRA